MEDGLGKRLCLSLYKDTVFTRILSMGKEINGKSPGIEAECRGFGDWFQGEEGLGRERRGIRLLEMPFFWC